MKANRAMKIVLVAYLFCGSLHHAIAQDASPSNIPRGLADLFFKEICPEGCSDEFARWQPNLKAEQHDLNGDGSPEFFLYVEHSDLCGAGANCDYWIYRQTGTRFNLILKDKNIRVAKTVSNGYRNLSSETPMGFCSKNVQRLYITPYKFDGGKYQPQQPRTDCRAFTSKL